MKWIRSRAAVLCLMALLGASASACSPYDLQDLLQEEPENIESESVKDSQNQQKAEAPAADTWQLEKPQREQISVGKYAYEHLDQHRLPRRSGTYFLFHKNPRPGFVPPSPLPEDQYFYKPPVP